MSPLIDNCVETTHFWSKVKFWCKCSYKQFNSTVSSSTCCLPWLPTNLPVYGFNVVEKEEEERGIKSEQIMLLKVELFDSFFLISEIIKKKENSHIPSGFMYKKF